MDNFFLSLRKISSLFLFSLAGRLNCYRQISMLWQGTFRVMKMYDILKKLPPLYWYQEGVPYVEYLLSFIIAVMGGVVCHYIIKWLDDEG